MDVSVMRRWSLLVSLPLALWATTASCLPASWGDPKYPTSEEFAAWPYYCHARHATLDDSPLRKPVSPEVITRARNDLGLKVYSAVHHYCWGLTWLRRAIRATDDSSRNWAAKQAIYETNFTGGHTPKDHWLYADMAITLGQAYRIKGELENGLIVMTEARALHPQKLELYSLHYVLLRAAGKMDEALHVLEEGGRRANGRYAEIEYFLGLEYLKREQTEKALEHAKKAYALGYPLPGLKLELQRLGIW